MMDEFNVKLASSSCKKHNVFKLHKDDQVSWSDAKMRRDNDFQPWQIKFGSGKTGRRFKAIREGGIGENSSYFIFYIPKGSSDTFEVCPVEEWFNMSVTPRYKTLTAEEAEQKFEQRNKTLNYFSVMHMKKSGENGDEGISGHDTKSFKVSEMDDWDESGDDLDDSGNENGNDDESKKKQRKKKSFKKEKDDPEDAPDEGKEDSDEGDFEQREVDYMSDTSSESSVSDAGGRDENDVKGIAEEEALRDLLSTDEEEESENSQQKSTKFGTSRTTTNDPYADGSDDSSDSDDYDVDESKIDTIFLKKDLPSQLVKLELKPESSNAGPSSQRQQQTVMNKRKVAPETLPPAPKRPCPVDTSPAMGQERAIEDLIKKYLGRKPMTLKNLLKDIKSKLKRLSGANSGMDDDLVGIIATIIKRLNPERQKINDITYFSLKAD